ncbi:MULTISPECIES: MerR family transcriptional regulator [Pseudonocardia]|uniref:Multidrug-efflux transporter 1 regulator n=2 Tax=Pseudonocardia TaxID=1847 RepID=A0A1Y2MMI5_PSEAH|nr:MULTISPECIES: MerR family transcriptional regulator [Pseudonocardia]OSY36453.1 Multidrug-efflux transporter 1 regulator [Pseudonocardia autotrophica]TDN74745.1 DNA-binding transcriptional MerR regulator [Pseudonocardia autotrophica]BBG05520.1 MerR family transcriptional regulator [Pseudonocardia autotrophica]GEC28045.1 MerR family transcriptional regulator [Pseudonocardia saturnea]
MTALLSIGDFAAVTHLSIRTLRRYHRDGLLEPARVDPGNGYRWYGTDQIADAQVIRRFRELDMPVPEIARILRTADLDARSALVAGHLARLEDRLTTTRNAVAALRRLLDPAGSPVEIVRRTDPARRVAAVRGETTHDSAPAWYARAAAEIDAALVAAGARPAGPPGGEYANALFTGGSGVATVYVPTDREIDDGRVHTVVLPARDLAVTVHHGPHDDIDVTYGLLGSHLAEHALVLGDGVVETYLAGPRDTADPAAWRTEIGRIVFSTSARG